MDGGDPLPIGKFNNKQFCSGYAVQLRLNAWKQSLSVVPTVQSFEVLGSTSNVILN